MAQNYSLDFMNTTNNFADIFINVNATHGGSVAGWLLLVVWVVVAMTFGTRNGFKDGAVVASFLTYIVGILFWAIGVISFAVTGIILTALIASIAFRMLT